MNKRSELSMGSPAVAGPGGVAAVVPLRIALPSPPDGVARERTLHGYDWLKPVAACLGLVSVSGCMMGPSAISPEETVRTMERFVSAGGYVPPLRFAVSELRETWKHGSTSLDVSLLVPDGAGPYPVVVYLPALGADAGSAPLWRRAWAEAGYAVMSLQPVAAANALKSLGGGGRGDVRDIGRRQFSRQSLERRLEHFAWGVDELRRLARSGRTPYRAMEPAKLAVAGYDLGAQTAAVLAGETVRAKRPDGAGLAGLRAAIVLSPAVDLAEGRLASRYKSIHLPLLAVTGDDDRDPYGISSPSLRSAIWQHGPAGDNYLLLLRDATHPELAGSEPGRPDGVPAGAPGSGPDEAEMPEESGRDPPTRSGGRRGGGFGGGGLGMAAFGGPPRRRSGDGRLPAAVRAVTTAFLDATVKADPAARQWLQHSAPGWLAPVGVLKSK